MLTFIALIVFNHTIVKIRILIVIPVVKCRILRHSVSLVGKLIGLKKNSTWYFFPHSDKVSINSPFFGLNTPVLTILVPEARDTKNINKVEKIEQRVKVLKN